MAAGAGHPKKRVVLFQGASSFGFSGMEFETVVRHQLPITVVIINNNGIGGGPSAPFTPEDAPPGAYTFEAHYGKVAEAFGAKGWFVTRPEELKPTLQAGLDDPR